MEIEDRRLPEWKYDKGEPRPPEPMATLRLGPHATIQVERTHGSLYIYFSALADRTWRSPLTENAALRLILAEAEKVLPILRALVAQIDEQAPCAE